MINDMSTKRTDSLNPKKIKKLRIKIIYYTSSKFVLYITIEFGGKCDSNVVLIVKQVEKQIS